MLKGLCIAWIKSAVFVAQKYNVSANRQKTNVQWMSLKRTLHQYQWHCYLTQKTSRWKRKNKWENREALSAWWHLPSTITLTFTKTSTESTSSNNLLKAQAANTHLGFLVPPQWMKPLRSHHVRIYTFRFPPLPCGGRVWALWSQPAH